ncbi:MAG: hypothetical protein J1F39_00235 [Clostridiales bacterium]|nr:hypothetical protein [Clostridiales bacterium]
MKLNPPKRKSASAVVKESEHTCGDKKYFRRDYVDGSADLITYNEDKGYWLFETFTNKKILGMEYDFEYCLSSPIFCGLYFVSATVIFDAAKRSGVNKRRKV